MRTAHALTSASTQTHTRTRQSVSSPSLFVAITDGLPFYTEGRTTHIHTHTNASALTQTNTHTHTHTHIAEFAESLFHTQTHKHTNTHTRKHTHTQTHKHTHNHTHTHSLSHTHAHTAELAESIFAITDGLPFYTVGRASQTISGVGTASAQLESSIQVLPCVAVCCSVLQCVAVQCQTWGALIYVYMCVCIYVFRGQCALLMRGLFLYV